MVKDKGIKNSNNYNEIEILQELNQKRKTRLIQSYVLNRLKKF